MAPSGGGALPPLGTLSEETVRTWTDTRVKKACFEYNIVPPTPFDDVEAWRAFLLAQLRAARGAHVKTAQDSAAPSSPLSRTVQTPTLGPEDQDDDPSVPFGSGVFSRSRSLSPPPSRNLAKEFEAVEQLERDNPFYRQDVLDTLREDARMVPTFFPSQALGAHETGYGSSPGRVRELDDESMGVPSPRWRNAKRTRADRSPQWPPRCAPRTRAVPGQSPPPTKRQTPTPMGEPTQQTAASSALPSPSVQAQDVGHGGSAPDAGQGRARQGGSIPGLDDRIPDRGGETHRVQRAQPGTSDGNVLRQDAELQVPSLNLSTAQWHCLVQLPERPDERQLRPLSKRSLDALAEANGIPWQEGWNSNDCRQAIAQWVREHPADQLLLPLGRLRLGPSPLKPRSGRRQRRSPSYDGMIETETASRSSTPISRPSSPVGGQKRSEGRQAQQRRGSEEPERRQLPVRSVAALVVLPLRPTRAQLRTVKYAGLQALMKTNGLRRDKHENTESMLSKLLGWLAEDAAREVQLPQGLQRRRAEPLGQPQARQPGRSRPPSHLLDPNMSPSLDPASLGRVPHLNDGDYRMHIGGRTSRRTEQQRRADDRSTTSPLPRQFAESRQTEHTNPEQFSRRDHWRGPVDAGTTRQAMRAAGAFRETASSLMELMEHLVPLVTRASRGENIPAAEFAPLGPAVHHCSAVLQGVVTGFTTENLCAALVGESRSPPQSSTGAQTTKQRSYAQVARTAAAAPPRPQPASLAPERTALLSPASTDQRHAPTRASAFGATLDAVLRRELHLGDRPAVELVRRTGKGDYIIQFSPVAWPGIPSSGSWTLADFGVWRRTTSEPFQKRSSVVLTGLPASLSHEAMQQELATHAAQRWPALAKEELSNIRVERLHRRVKDNNGPSSSTNRSPNWAPSTSIRLFGSQALCDAILEAGGTVLGFSFHKARPFQPATRRCMRCGHLGTHNAQYCRNPPRCRHCGRAHETLKCPSIPPADPAMQHNEGNLDTEQACSPRVRATRVP